MDIIFIILCSIIFLSPYALVSKVLAGMILVALFEIISKNTNTIKLFGRIIIAACVTAAHFVYTYVTGDYVSLRNSIMIALLINSVMSVYILTLLMIVELLKKLTFHNV